MKNARVWLASACLLLFSFGSVYSARLTVCDDVSDPATLDPHKQFSEKNHTIVQQIYEGLVRFDPDGRIEPALAESWERMDALRTRFHLRKNVAFHNGEPFNAKAVLFSIGRYLDPKTGFPALGFISSLDRAEEVDAHTVDIVTKYPDGLLLNRLAGFILIAPPGYVKENGEAALHEHPVGTGPFRFVKWVKGDNIALSASPDYWLPGHPKFNELVFRFAPADQQVDLLLKGDVDLVTELPGTMTARVVNYKGTKVLKKNTFWTVGASMNVSREPLSNVRVRQAMNLALNKEELVRYDSFGNGKILASLTMNGEGGHNQSLEPYPYNLEKAKQLLTESGVKTPLTLKTLVRTQGERAARIMAAHLAKIGVTLDLKVFSDADVIQGFQSADWDIAIAGLPDPMCHSFFIPSILLFSQSPFSLTRNKDFDGQLLQMASTLDETKRDELARQLDAYVHDQALSLFTYQKIKTYGLNSNVDFVPSISGMPYFFRTEPHKADAVVPAKKGG